MAGYAYNRFFIEVYHIPHDSDKSVSYSHPYYYLIIRYTYLGHSINLANLAMFGIVLWFIDSSSRVSVLIDTSMVCRGY